MADPQMGERGLGKLAHAVRRSTALHCAVQITPPESTVEDLLAVADQLATWIRGSVDDSPEDRPGTTPAWQQQV